MQVILLERVKNLGMIGDIVSVKDGFARNFLIPQSKALRANKQNLASFDERRANIESANLERKQDAQKVADKLDGVSVICIRQASDAGNLYGSVTARDIVNLLDDKGYTVEKRQIFIKSSIKHIGIHDVTIEIHPEVDATVSVVVAKTEDEAELLQKSPSNINTAQESQDIAVDHVTELQAVSE